MGDMTVSTRPHRHAWHVEQQTGHRFCDMCGQHDPPDPHCADRPSHLWEFVQRMDGQEIVRVMWSS